MFHWSPLTFHRILTISYGPYYTDLYYTDLSLRSVYTNQAFFISYEYEEITPILKGTWRYKQTKSGSFEGVSELTKAEEIRSLIETQEWIRAFGATV